MTKQLHFVLIGLESSWFIEQTQNQIQLQLFRSPSEITGNPDCIVLNPEKGEQQLNWLRELRSNKNFNNLLILTLMSEAELDPESKILIDNPWQSLEIASINIRNWQRQVELFHAGDNDSPVSQTLKYLWSDDKRRLLPLADWQSPQTYRYPLLQCFGNNDEAARLLLEELRSRSYIKHDLMVDRVRTCSACKRAHLSFIDVCPSCQSVDIEKQKSLHCFNCGFVGPESNFQRNGVLVCPNCDTRLRHIGTDYDRPFEQYACKTCNDLFIEPDVRARCMQCGKNSNPNELTLDVISTYRLGEKGREACRHGEAVSELNNLMHLDLLPTEVFTFAVNWLDKLTVRYQEQPYSLITLKINNVAAFLESKGYEEAQATVIALSNRVRAEIRTTDLCTRTADDLYFFLFPSTPKEGAQVIKEKFAGTITIALSDVESSLKIDMASFSSAKEKPEAQNIAELMGMLANEVSE